MPVIDITTPAPTARRYRWQNKQRRAKRCWLCADPVTRLCMNKECNKYRDSMPDKKCPGCKKKTRAVKLCAAHLLRDRQRKPKRGPK